MRFGLLGMGLVMLGCGSRGAGADADTDADTDTGATSGTGETSSTGSSSTGSETTGSTTSTGTETSSESTDTDDSTGDSTSESTGTGGDGMAGSWFFPFVEPESFTRVRTMHAQAGGVVATVEVSQDAEFGGQVWDYGAYFLRLDLEGELLWARRFTGVGFRSLEPTPDGGFRVAATYSDDVTLGEGQNNETTVLDTGGPQTFIAQYEDDGTLTWADSVPHSLESAYPLSDGTMIVTGYFYGLNPVILNEGQPGEIVLMGDDNSLHGFVAQLDPPNDFLWGQVWHGDIQGAARLDNDDLAVLVAADHTLVLAKDTADELTLPLWGGGDAWIVRLQPDGKRAWTGQMGGGFRTYARDIAVDGAGGIYVAGEWAGTASFDPLVKDKVTRQSQNADYDTFLARIDGDGGLEWIRTDGGPAMDFGRGVARLDSGDVVYGGAFRETGHFGGADPGAVDLVAPDPPTRSDVFIARYEADGTFVSVVHGTGEWDDFVEDIEPFGDGVLSSMYYGEAASPVNVAKWVTFFPGTNDEIQIDADFDDAILARVVPPAG